MSSSPFRRTHRTSARPSTRSRPVPLPPRGGRVLGRGTDQGDRVEVGGDHHPLERVGKLAAVLVVGMAPRCRSVQVAGTSRDWPSRGPRFSDGSRIETMQPHSTTPTASRHTRTIVTTFHVLVPRGAVHHRRRIAQRRHRRRHARLCRWGGGGTLFSVIAITSKMRGDDTRSRGAVLRRGRRRRYAVSRSCACDGSWFGVRTRRRSGGSCRPGPGK